MTYRLGTGIAQIIPLHRVPIQQEPAVGPKKEVITTKLVIVMAIVAIVKISILLML
jgi:hypothetical protein